MNSFSASYRFGLRAPARSKLALTLFAMVAAVVILLPSRLHSDGTTAGDLRMILTWTLGTAGFLLGAATLWAGCASFSTEIEDKRYVAAALSPARRFPMVLGRFLGLLTLDAALLAFALAGVRVQIARRGFADGETTVMRVLGENARSLEEEENRLFGKLCRIDPGIEADNRGPLVRESLRADFASGTHLPIGPGENTHWRITLPDGADEGISVKFEFLSSYGAGEGVRGALEVRADDENGTILAARDVVDADGGRVELALPPVVSAKELYVEFKNSEDEENGVSVLVKRGSVRAFVPAGGVCCNLLRAGLVMLAGLALLSALGFALGCAFSFPVAAFVAVALCALVSTGSSYTYTDDTTAAARAHGHSGSVPQGLEHFAHEAASVVRAPVAPLMRAETLDRLGDNILVDGNAAFSAVVFDGAVLPLLLCAAGALALRKRGS